MAPLSRKLFFGAKNLLSQPNETASSEHNCLTLKIHYSEFNLENSDMLRKVGHKILFYIKYVAIIFGRRSFQKLKWQLCQEAVTLFAFIFSSSFLWYILNINTLPAKLVF